MLIGESVKWQSCRKLGVLCTVCLELLKKGENAWAENRVEIYDICKALVPQLLQGTQEDKILCFGV